MFQSLKAKLQSLSLSYYLTFALVSAIFCGVLYRYFPAQLSLIGLNPNKLYFLGTVFLTMMKMIISPLIFTSIVSSALSIGDAKETGKLAFQCILTFLVMTAVSVVIGMSSVHFVKPGKNVTFDKQALIEKSYSAVQTIQQNAPKQNITSVGDFIMSFIPKNIFEALRTDNFLPIIFFAILIVIATLQNKELQNSSFINGIKSAGDIILNMGKIINKFAPFGIFGATFWVIATQDVAMLKAVGKLMFCVYGSCLFIIYVLYASFAVFVLKLNPIYFFKKCFPAQLFGFLLTSSSAALPMSLEISKKGLGIRQDRANFIVNLGATMNMNGGATYFGTVVLFVSQLYNIPLTNGDIIFAIVVATFAAVGTAPVPNSAIIMLPGVLMSVGLPLESIAIMFAFERIFNMIRAFTNIAGDIFSAVIISKLTGCLDEKVYNKQ